MMTNQRLIGEAGVCAAAQQGVQEGDVSWFVTLGPALAGSQAGLWRAVPVELAMRPGHHGKIPQVAHLLVLKCITALKLACACHHYRNALWAEDARSGQKEP
jgi:hypothetical protein